MKAGDFKLARFHIIDNNVEQCIDSQCLMSHKVGLYQLYQFGDVLIDQWVSDYETWQEAEAARQSWQSWEPCAHSEIIPDGLDKGLCATCGEDPKEPTV